MAVSFVLLGLLGVANALPLDLDGQFANQIKSVKDSLSTNSMWPCFAKECKKPTKKYEHILPGQPGVQWMDHGGYCGSWSVQRTAMVKGAWISQAQVRAHAKPGGGNDNEILATNIDDALKSLKLKAEGFDYKHLPTPQADAYRKWIKAKIVAGHGVVWMIMQPGERYPVYPTLPKNSSQYGHIEPVMGILSDHALNDTALYDDDYVVHFTDADVHPYYRSMQSLPDNTQYTGNCRSSHYTGYPCIYDQLGFGWAIEGFLDTAAALPLSLTVQPAKSEPNTRTGSKPEALSGTVTTTGLTAGTKYAIYRWDSVQAAFDYSKPHSVHRFTATSETEVYTDAESFSSDSATYYRCILDAGQVVV